jgi:hypothetical protein
MRNIGQSTEQVEALQALTDRLFSPDLTLDEAKELQGRVLALTGVDRELESAFCSMPCDGHRDGARSPECRYFAA